MQERIIGAARGLLLAAGVALVSACATAAAAGAGAAAGAAGGVYLTEQGAEGTVASALPMVDTRTQAVLSDMGIQVKERKAESDEVEYHGTGNGMDVAVELDVADNGGTVVRASARKNLVEWDRNYARSIVQRITQRM